MNSPSRSNLADIVGKVAASTCSKLLADNGIAAASQGSPCRPQQISHANVHICPSLSLSRHNRRTRHPRIRRRPLRHIRSRPMTRSRCRHLSPAARCDISTRRESLQTRPPQWPAARTTPAAMMRPSPVNLAGLPAGEVASNCCCCRRRFNTSISSASATRPNQEQNRDRGRYHDHRDHKARPACRAICPPSS